MMMTTMAPARLDDLGEIEAAVWAELAAAPRDKHHGWRIGVLATVESPPPSERDDAEEADAVDDLDAAPPVVAAAARNVMLREFVADERVLLIYADARSPKAAQIAAHPLGTLVLWSDVLGWQLRLRVVLSVHTSGLKVSSRWARLKMTPAAHDYLSPLPPGSPLARPDPKRSTREHFAVIEARIEAVDWLELHADGHRRAAFDAAGARWLVP